MLVAGTLTVACQSNEVVPGDAEPAAIAAPSTSGLLELIRYGNRVRDAIGTDLSGEYRRLAFGGAQRSNEASIQLSLLLSAPNAAYHDVEQAARVLRGVLDRTPAGDDEQRALAELLLHLLDERVNAASDREALADLLSEARDRNEELTEELTVVRAELDEERERRRALEEQLDALKRLEEQLTLDAF